MITYSIKPSTEEGGEDTIVKTGQEHDFKMSDVKTHMEKLDKLKKELTAQIELEDAKMSNVKANHDIVHDLTDEQMTAVSLYFEAKVLKKKCEDKLEEVIQAQKEYDEELVEIKKQTGLSIEGV